MPPSEAAHHPSISDQPLLLLYAVVGLSDADLEGICASVRAATPGAVCQLANFLFPQGRVVSGAPEECCRGRLAWSWLAAVPCATLAGCHACCP